MEKQKNKNKVLLGLSGGVDSTAAALLLTEKGFDVTGYYFDVTGCNRQGLKEAQELAHKLGIQLICEDVSSEFNRLIINDFCDEYMSGRTPNPCVICNPQVKFRKLIEKADEIGAYHIATGHYCRIYFDKDTGLFYPKMSASKKKDQSYMLYRLPKEYINRLLLPLGVYASKDDVRADAEKKGIHIAKKSDSMEICFIPNDDHGAFIESRMPDLPKGNFVDESGKVLGCHGGIYKYTVGQRRGLGISAASRLFVTDIDPESGDITLSDKDIYRDFITVSDGNIIFDRYRELSEFDCMCKIRHSKTEYPAHVKVIGEGFEVFFKTPSRAPTPGQSAVFYDGDTVIGGGYIEKYKNK